MKIKLTANLCYLAGLQDKARFTDRAIGISTRIDELEQRFTEICVKELKIEPNRIIVREEGGSKQIYFYHSKIYRELLEINSNATRIFRYSNNEFSRMYVAGIFDAAGHAEKGRIRINGLTRSDELVLENLGIHTMNGTILNAGPFVKLIKGFSIMLGHYAIDK